MSPCGVTLCNLSSGVVPGGPTPTPNPMGLAHCTRLMVVHPALFLSQNLFIFRFFTNPHVGLNLHDAVQMFLRSNAFRDGISIFS